MVKKKTIDLFFGAIALFAIIEPTAFIGTWVHSFCGIIRSFLFIFCVLLYLIDRQYRELEGNIILLYLLVLGFTTFIYQGSFSADYTYLFRCTFSGIVLLQFFMKRNAIGICKVMAIILSIFLMFDAMTFILPGLGLGKVTDDVIKCFLGSKTTITYFMIPAIGFDYTYLSVCPKKDKWKAKFWLLLAIGSTIVYLLQIFISTTAVCLVLLIASMWGIKKFKIVTNFVAKYGFWISSALIVMIITGMSVGGVEYFVTSILGESGDFNGRVQIWQMAFANILRRPLMGYGLGTKIYLAVWQTTNVSAHNLFIGILLRSGIVGLLSYFIIVILCLRNHRKNKTNILQNFLILTMIVVNIMGFSEEFIAYPIIYFLYLLIANSEKYLKLCKK